jgi:hypothetical protein
VGVCLAFSLLSHCLVPNDCSLLLPILECLAVSTVLLLVVLVVLLMLQSLNLRVLHLWLDFTTTYRSEVVSVDHKGV